MPQVPIKRRIVLAGAAAAAVSGPVRIARAAPGRRLPQRGVNYDTERAVRKPEFVRREIRAIRRDLRCNALIVLGSGLGRLMRSARYAANEGMFVWLEPRQFDRDARTTLRFLAFRALARRYAA